MATVTFGYINNLWHASCLTYGTQQWYMHLKQDNVVTDHYINVRFSPHTYRNQLAELASLCTTGTVDDYKEHFLAHVALVGALEEQ